MTDGKIWGFQDAAVKCCKQSLDVHKILAYVQDHWVYVSEIFLLYTPTINPICLDTTVNVYIHPHTPISPMLNFIHLYHKSIFHSHLVGEICTVYTNIVSYIPGTIPQTN